MKKGDRDYFTRIGVAKERAAELGAVELAEMSVAQRLALGVDLSKMALAMGSPPPDDDPTPFYDRARSLGLYRP